MKINVNEEGMVQLEDVFNSIVFKTSEGHELIVCMRDGGFEIATNIPKLVNAVENKQYYVWYRVYNGEVLKLGGTMNNIQKCPNCIEQYTDGYKQGYSDAFKLFNEQIKLASESCPIQIKMNLKEVEERQFSMSDEDFEPMDKAVIAYIRKLYREGLLKEEEK